MVHLAPRVLLRISLIVILALVLIDLLRGLADPTDFGELYRIFSLDSERSIGTLYAVLQLAACATGALLTGWLLRRRRLPWSTHWTAMGVLLGIAMLDEKVSLHELGGDELADTLDTTGPLYFAWVAPATVVVLVLGIVFLRFVLALPATIRTLAIAAAAVYVTGALGFESLGGWVIDTEGGSDTRSYVLLYVIEETLELVGVALLGYAIARFLQEHQEPLWATTGPRSGTQVT